MDISESSSSRIDHPVMPPEKEAKVSKMLMEMQYQLCLRDEQMTPLVADLDRLIADFLGYVRNVRPTLRVSVGMFALDILTIHLMSRYDPEFDVSGLPGDTQTDESDDDEPPPTLTAVNFPITLVK